MVTKHVGSAEAILRPLDGLLPDLETLYKDIHAHPELSMQETRTANIAAERLRAAGFDVTTGVGKTGVVGLLRNGDGPTVMLRADMDALPIKEATGLPYASTVTAKDSDGKTVPVTHACGHDMHVTWLVGAATLFAQARDAWHGTLMAVFQPAEETAAGAQAMIDDGLFKRFPKPDVMLGQHVMAGSGRHRSAGARESSPPPATACRFTLFGRGAHGSMPQASIDPVVMAAATVMRLQTIVSREIAATEAAVVTVGVASGRHEGERHPRRGHHQAERAHLRRGRAQARARRHQADRQGRGGRFGGHEAAGDHAARPLFARDQ